MPGGANARGLFGCKILFHDSARVWYARRGPPLRTVEVMTSRHNILPECGMTDFRSLVHGLLLSGCLLLTKLAPDESPRHRRKTVP